MTSLIKASFTLHQSKVKEAFLSPIVPVEKKSCDNSDPKKKSEKPKAP